MENKRIVFTAPNKAEYLPCEIKEPDDYEVLVQLAVSTISSGTERASLIGEVNISIHENFTEAHFPRYGGYSSSGTVIRIGKRVTSLQPGDRVAMSWSTHQRYICIAEANVYKIDDTIPFEEAALWHIGTFPMAAIRKCHLEIGESAIVMGLGILGRVAVLMLHAAGAVPIIAVDPVAEKRQQALAFGADYALDPNDPDFAKTVKSLTNGGVNVAIEVTGIGKALDQVLDCMACFGRVALLGCTRHSDFTIDYYHKVHGPGITLIGAHTDARPKHDSFDGYWTQRDDMLAQIRLHKHGRLKLSSMVEETHLPTEAPLVYTRLAMDKSFPLIQFDWRT